MSIIKWGIIGLGNIALKFAQSFSEISNSKLLGIASIDSNKIELFKNQFKIQKEYCFKSYIDLIKNQDIDIVYLALPHNFHYQWIIECLKENKNILTEKPAVISSNNINEIVKKHSQKNIFFAESFVYRYHPQTAMIIDLIKNNKIGELISMESYFGSNIIEKKKFFGLIKRIKINKKNRLFNKNLGGGAIWDIGCYPSSMSLLISSLKSEINQNFTLRNSKIIREPAEVDLESHTEIQFENGFKSKIGCSFKSNLGYKTKIFGSKGNLIIDSSWDCDKGHLIFDQKEYKIEHKYNNNFTYQIEMISSYLNNKEKEPRFPGMRIKETVLNTKILEKWINSYE